MDEWIKGAYLEQHRARLLQQAAKERQLRNAKEDGLDKHANGIQKEVRPMKRRLALAGTIVFIAAIWIVQVVAAAGLGGAGGGFYNVM